MRNNLFPNGLSNCPLIYTLWASVEGVLLIEVEGKLVRLFQLNRSSSVVWQIGWFKCKQLFFFLTQNIMQMEKKSS